MSRLDDGAETTNPKERSPWGGWTIELGALSGERARLRLLGPGQDQRADLELSREDSRLRVESQGRSMRVTASKRGVSLTLGADRPAPAVELSVEDESSGILLRDRAGVVRGALRLSKGGIPSLEFFDSKGETTRSFVGE